MTEREPAASTLTLRLLGPFDVRVAGNVASDTELAAAGENRCVDDVSCRPRCAVVRQSVRSACSGSTRVARAAGSTRAAIAIAIKMSGAQTSVIGSVGLRP